MKRSETTATITIDPFVPAGAQLLTRSGAPKYVGANQFTARARWSPIENFSLRDFKFDTEETGYFTCMAGRNDYEVKAIDGTSKSVRAGSMITYGGENYIVTRSVTRRDLRNKRARTTLFVKGPS